MLKGRRYTLCSVRIGYTNVLEGMLLWPKEYMPQVKEIDKMA